MAAAVVLLNPKTPYNVGSVIRACAIFGAPTLRWTGERVEDPKRFNQDARRMAGTSTRKTRARLPREERMKDYVSVDWQAADDGVLDSFVDQGYTPIAVEVREASEFLDEFVHPEKAVYVFGPEDGSIDKGTLSVCHRFVRIRTPHRTPLNLAAAANVVLHDRYIKGLQPWLTASKPA